MAYLVSGRIVRIAPDEVHILDADFWETLFSRAGRVDKYSWMSNRFGNETSVLTTAAHDLHRVRRNALNPYFSRQRILGLQHTIRQKLSIFVSQIREHANAGMPVTINRGYMAFSEDVIMHYCFGYDYDTLRKPAWTPALHDAFAAVCIAGNMALQFPIVPKVMNALPQAWVEKLDPLYALIFRMQNDFGRQIRQMKATLSSTLSPAKGGKDVDDTSLTVITELLQSNLPNEQKADRRVQDEVQLIVGAGVSTTGWTLSVGTYYLVANPRVLACLCKELDNAIPASNSASVADLVSNLDWTELEKLPYLTAVIKEAVRLSYSTTSRNVRLLPKPVQFGEWIIPARTPISMTVPFINHDEDIFPQSRSFVPERWLDAPKTANGSSLDKYFVGFGKGTRSCLGSNLAWCELYLVFASLFRLFDFALYETDQTDIDFEHDFFLPFPKLDSKGIRVLVKERH
ncbi:Sterol 26-hydroxylase, mitochondrial [Talaromyces islandicus]|uniref:Sterol 26-hydroxylase, mitochondrial n=1 Tax=Talaromyces islandicus TaxID=28573 RepID=A0A0U1MAV2_TALIS|nr:Sterol 26-hydroxylase, mitochondrial [Talaromyces islandicus]